MDRFVDRQTEMAELNRLLAIPGGQFIPIYGRRRVGKTTLLLHWAQQTKRPYIYWVARRETAEASRHSLARALWAWAYPDLQNPEPPRFDSWEMLFREMIRMISNKPVIIILDEFPYIVESDPSFPSHLQAAWDHMFKDKPVFFVLAGSHIGMMVDMMAYKAPLHGRFTAQMPIDPLPFAALREFFPKYDAAERVATYAVLGGIPAYLEHFNPQANLSDNIRGNLFRRTGMFRSEPDILVSDLVRETRVYESVLRAVANDLRTPAEISVETGIPPQNLPPYLKRLGELRLIERRTPATIPALQRQTTTRSRYHVRDPYLRFYFRFIEPNQEMIEMGLVDTLWERIAEQFRAFIGATTFEELCREWIVAQAQIRQLPFTPEIVGSHWSTEAQIDVVAINWREKAILLGECKWGVGAVGRSVIQELFEKSSKVVPGPDWQVHYAFFARAGFTAAARQTAEEAGAMLIDLEKLDADLLLALNRTK
jgi:AAA+ ATPase superfamily predicted ATPase